MESHALLSLSQTMCLIPLNKVSTDYADTMSAVVKLAEEIDESVRHGPMTSSCDKVLRAVLSFPSRQADCGMPMLCLSRRVRLV